MEVTIPIRTGYLIANWRFPINSDRDYARPITPAQAMMTTGFAPFSSPIAQHLFMSRKIKNDILFR
jgi:hypothetical protein